MFPDSSFRLPPTGGTLIDERLLLADNYTLAGYIRESTVRPLPTRVNMPFYVVRFFRRPDSFPDKESPLLRRIQGSQSQVPLRRMGSPMRRIYNMLQ